MNTVYIKTYDEPAFVKNEILRYAGVHSDIPEISEMIDGCTDEIKDKLTYKVCYREFPIMCKGDSLDLGFTVTESKDLKKNLSGCDRVLLFAATVGIEIDRLMARYAAISPARSLIFQAIGAERIESLCDLFVRDVTEGKRADGLNIRPRFSPGYGDLPLEVQRDIFAVLDCPRKIGLSLSESLLMSPSKSVTAIVGISKNRREI